MTREEARKAAEVMLAYANGEEVEVMDFDGKYQPTENPSFNWTAVEYRVKPKPTYRPFKTQEECWNEMLKHQPFGWLKSKTSKSAILIGSVYYTSKEVWIILATDETDSCSASDLFNNFTFSDGIPFGIKEGLA